MKMLPPLTAIILGLGAVIAHEPRAQDFQFCSEYGDPGRNPGIDVKTRVKAVRSGRITPGKTVPLHKQPTASCDSTMQCASSPEVRLLAGTEGVELGRNQSWVCIAAPGKKPLEVLSGWIPEKRWEDLKPKSTPTRWLGTWQNEHAKIKINVSTAEQLSVVGNAIWVGGHLATHRFGEFEITARPDGDMLSSDSFALNHECRVALRLVGSFMFAADNGNCGTTNVTFDGLYRYRSRQP